MSGTWKVIILTTRSNDLLLTRKKSLSSALAMYKLNNFSSKMVY